MTAHPEDCRLATHEAGHAVVALHYGWTITSASIRHPGGGGAVWIERPDPAPFDDLDDELIHTASQRDQMGVFLLAGPLACLVAGMSMSMAMEASAADEKALIQDWHYAEGLRDWPLWDATYEVLVPNAARLAAIAHLLLVEDKPTHERILRAYGTVNHAGPDATSRVGGATQ